MTRARSSSRARARAFVQVRTSTGNGRRSICRMRRTSRTRCGSTACARHRRCPAPVIARVHGYALGGGSGLAACADVAIAAPDAVFGFSEVKLGIIPAVISPFVLPKIGAHARRYFLTGERFDAETALRIGLIEEIADDLDAAVDRVLFELLTAGPEAVREAKRLDSRAAGRRGDCADRRTAACGGGRTGRVACLPRRTERATTRRDRIRGSSHS